MNALAEPLGGGALVDPCGGADDLAARRLRMVAPDAFRADPLRPLRLARLAVELGFDVDRPTAAAAREAAPMISGVAAERVFAELSRLLLAPAAVRGLVLLDDLRLTEVLLPEVAALHGVQQSAYHHRDVHGHTLEVLQAAVDLERDPGTALGGELAEGGRSRSWPSRWPTASPAPAACASGRSCTTSPSRPRASSCPAAASASRATTRWAPTWRGRSCGGCGPACACRTTSPS